MMTLDEKYKLLVKEREAYDSGDMEEVLKIRALIPLDPEMANSAKKIYGIKYLKETGFNLSEAEAKYGEDWSK